MPLPIAHILWAGNNASHNDHLHVEGDPVFVGWTNGQGSQPPFYNPGQTDAVKAIYAAMEAGYGTGYYFQDTPPAEPRWSHMGWYNRRPIAGSTRWSQHAWANALDIGPLYGVAEQAEFYDYLINYEEDDMPTADEIREIVRQELDRPIEGSPQAPGSFWGIQQALLKAPVGKTGLASGQHWELTLKDTDDIQARLTRIEKKIDELEAGSGTTPAEVDAKIGTHASNPDAHHQ